MLLLLLSTLSLVLPQPDLAPTQDGIAVLQKGRKRAAHEVPPTQLFDVLRVVDGDTIHIQRNGRRDKLRLLSVDTEEKLSEKPRLTGTKPETVFGTETMHWAQDFFASLAQGDEPAQVGLAFPGDEEKRDVYGRLLCHVMLPDGTDFNLKLVREGWSPYFNKYGNSMICHEAFKEAQVQARTKKIGIWNPATNVPKTANTPSASRPYELLLPWWEARGEAVEHYRKWKKRAPLEVVATDDADGLMLAYERCHKDPELTVTVFGTVTDRSWEDEGGGITILLRPYNMRDTKRGVRAVLTSEASRQAINKALDIEGRDGDFMQNYFYLTGKIEMGDHGLVMTADDPSQWRLAGPEPLIPTAKPGTEQ